MGLFSPDIERRTALHWFDDGSFKLEKREFEDACLVEKKDKEVIRAWKHFYTAEIPFDGYKGMTADMVTMTFNRDFILDIFNKVPVSANASAGKPKANDEKSIREWTSQVAESERYKVMNKKGSMLLIEKITMWLGIALILELLLLFAAYGLKW